MTLSYIVCFTAHMKYIIWIVSPPNYPHSPGAFQEVADSLHASFIELDHECAIVTDLPEPAENVIIIGANLLTGHVPSHWIVYNLEQVTPGSPWITNWYIAFLRQHPVWDYSPANIKELGKLGINAQSLPIGYHATLTRIPNLEQESWFNNASLDVLMYGSVNERRQKIFDELKGSCNAHWAFGVYGNKRDELIARAKIVLNIHFYESKVFEIVRCSYLLANSKCVISETGVDGNALNEAVVFSPYGELSRTVLAYLESPILREKQSAKGFEIFSNMRQVDYLRAVL